MSDPATAPNQTSLVDLATAEFTAGGGSVVITNTSAGLALSFDLGTTRVNWNHAAWAVHELPAALDLTTIGGFRIQATTPRPRSDCGVYLAVREAESGAWYAHPWACGLNHGSTTGAAMLEDFHPAEWFAPADGGFIDDDLILGERIDALAIGCVQPCGVGEVALTVTSVTQLPRVAPAPVAVTVSGRLCAIEGVDCIPAGVFGGYHLPEGHWQRYRLAIDRAMHHDPVGQSPSEPKPHLAFTIDTLGDRVRPSTRLTHADWAEQMAALGERFATAANTRDQPMVIEFWNEPYLNWANRNRANFIPALFDLDSVAEGGAVRIAHDGAEVPHLRWTKHYAAAPWNWCSERDWRRGVDDNGQSPSVHAPPYKGMAASYGGDFRPSTHPDPDIADGAAYQVEIDGVDTTLTATTPWHIYDETQFTFWSGAGMVSLYTEPFLAFAQPLKELAPQAMVIAGWGMRPSEDHWAAWRLLYRPVIDAAPDLIDAICDHDYGGDPASMAAVYQSVCAYAVGHHGRRIIGCNTECAVGSDPQAIPAAAELDPGAAADRRKASWTARKILATLAQVPDKVLGMLHFGYQGPWFSDQGEGVALDLLRPLRGRLVEVACSDPRVFAVASIDGTDPQAPRPDDLGPGQELVIAAINGGRETRTVSFVVDAPAGSDVATDAVVTAMRYQAGAPSLVPVSGHEIAGGQVHLTLSLPAHEAVCLRLPLTQPIAADQPATVVHQTAYPDCHLEALVGEYSIRTLFDLPGRWLTTAERASVRLVVDHLQAESVIITLGDTEIVVPGGIAAENGARLVDVPVPLAALRGGRQQIDLRLAGPTAMPVRIISLAITVVGPADPA